MKKLTRLLAVALTLVAASASPLLSHSQRGEKTLGVMGGLATYNNGGYANVYFQYTFVPHVRIAPEIGYVFRNEGKSAFEMSIDMHFPFRLAKGFAIYPLVGVTFNNWNYYDDGHATRGGADFGGGLELYLTSKLKLNVQGKYSLMNDTGGGFIGAGLGYVF